MRRIVPFDSSIFDAWHGYAATSCRTLVAMHRLTHYRLCPRSRSLRLAAGELGITLDQVEQEPWSIGPQFLSLNPAGELPVLEIQNGPILCGIYAAAGYVCCDLEKTDDRQSPALQLFAKNSEDRAEVRRLTDWFHNKLDREVTRELLFEKLYARKAKNADQGPNPEILRIARANLKYHLSYISYLADLRTWLAGDELTFADLAAAGHLSALDYLGEVPWADYPVAKAWYQRLKSRPAFRTLLEDRVPGMPPVSPYVDLDF